MCWSISVFSEMRRSKKKAFLCISCPATFPFSNKDTLHLLWNHIKYEALFYLGLVCSANCHSPVLPRLPDHLPFLWLISDCYKPVSPRKITLTTRINSKIGKETNSGLETNLQPGEFSQFIEGCLPNYKSLTAARTSGHAGGLAVVFKDEFKCTIEVDNLSNCEALMFKPNCAKPILCLLHRLPKMNSVFLTMC